MSTIQIRGISEDGVKYTLNHLRGDNALVTGGSKKEMSKRRDELIARCWLMVMKWHDMYPHDTIRVVEVRSTDNKGAWV